VVAFAVRRILVKWVRGRLIPRGDLSEKFVGAGRRILVRGCLSFHPMLTLLPCPSLVVWCSLSVAPGLVDVVSRIHRCNALLGAFMSLPSFYGGTCLSFYLSRCPR
jgi:hypothetical protein